jgi:hypothetical protein
VNRRAPDTSASYAAEVARLLWPSPWEAPEVTRTRHRPAPDRRDAYIFPSRRRPRLLVPADLPGSSAMVRRLGADRSQLAAPARSALEWSLRSRTIALTRWPMLRVRGTDPEADSIEHHLSESLGTEVRVGILLGTRRVNQKPVLQIFRHDGMILGYAKVGHNDLTAALVRREADALATVAALLPHSFRPPRVLHHARWAGLEVLVTSPLTTNRRPVTRAAQLSAAREIAGLPGTTHAQVGVSAFWSRRREAAALLAGTPEGPRLESAARAIEERHGADHLAFGAWHGDWGHWNMGMADDALQVWDWERYDAEVPVGFDPLHFVAQTVRPGQRDAPRQEAAFLDAVPAALSELGVHEPDHELTLRLYLLEASLRYVDALRHGATPALERRTAWVLSLLERRLGISTTSPTEGRS